jgi:DNA polymerase-1
MENMLRASPANIQEAYRTQLFDTLPTLVNIMNRGVRTNRAEKDRLYTELTGIMAVIREELDFIVGEPFNPLSPDQKKALFYDLFELPVQLDPKTKKPTLSADALSNLADAYPLIRPVADRVSEFGNLKTFSSTFLKARLDEDLRMRTSYNMCGTDTYRLSSSENAFGSGMNLKAA